MLYPPYNEDLDYSDSDNNADRSLKQYKKTIFT